MTTGYDCTDILNLALMRPIFSPSDFVQMKGRGTRKHNFAKQMTDPKMREKIELEKESEKSHFKLFDFFANCEYFEERFSYDEVLQLPQVRSDEGSGGDPPAPPSKDGEYTSTRPDVLQTATETPIGPEGMKIDRMLFNRFEDIAKADQELKARVENQQWDLAERHVKQHHFDKPEDYFNLKKLRSAIGVDRRVSLREILEKIFGLITKFQSKDERLEEEFQKFAIDSKPPAQAFNMIQDFFKAYIDDPDFREIIDMRDYQGLNTNPSFGWKDFQAVPEEWRKRIPEYIKDYVPLNQFM